MRAGWEAGFGPSSCYGWEVLISNASDVSPGVQTIAGSVFDFLSKNDALLAVAELQASVSGTVVLVGLGALGDDLFGNLFTERPGL